MAKAKWTVAECIEAMHICDRCDTLNCPAGNTCGYLEDPETGDRLYPGARPRKILEKYRDQINQILGGE